MREIFKHRKLWRIASSAALAALILAPIAPLDADARGGKYAELKEYLYPPRKIMKHADELELTRKQRQTIKAALRAANAQISDLRFELQEEQDRLTQMVAGDQDADAILAQADKVMALEARIKRTHLKLMLDVKGVLTAKQRQEVEAYLARKRGRKP